MKKLLEDKDVHKRKVDEIEEKENEIEKDMSEVEKRMRKMEGGLEEARKHRLEMNMQIRELKKDIERKENQLD